MQEAIRDAFNRAYFMSALPIPGPELTTYKRKRYKTWRCGSFPSADWLYCYAQRTALTLGDTGKPLQHMQLFLSTAPMCISLGMSVPMKVSAWARS